MSEFTPREIVSELDRYIIGQHDAKRAVAIALRNRWRRRQVASPMQEEIYPKNILMIGPTGVGKTEIARRLARLANAPFIKVEATKFTEVGYVGRDVESIIRDLVEIAVKMSLDESKAHMRRKAEEAAEERVLDILLPGPPTANTSGFYNPSSMPQPPEESSTRQKLRRHLREGILDDREVELEVREPRAAGMEIFTQQGNMEVFNLQEMLGNMLGANPVNAR